MRNVPTGPARKGPTGIEPARVTAGQPGTTRGAATRKGKRSVIDGRRIYYKTLNEQIREEIERGATEVVLDNVIGQRYIGTGLAYPGVTVTINGVPGNDLAAFMNGPTLVVNDNAQDGVANTMNSGLVVINGDAGDVIGYGMRGGAVYVRGDVGYRVGIHMKAFGDSHPLSWWEATREISWENTWPAERSWFWVWARATARWWVPTSAPACTRVSCTYEVKWRSTSWARRSAWWSRPKPTLRASPR